MSKQGELKGVERPKLRDVEEAADDYIKVRDKRKELLEEMKADCERLIVAMRRNKITRYAFDGYVIALEELEKINVKSVKEDDEGDDD